jgi:hypothetical protein
VAWFQRDFEVPKSWIGKRVTLFLERPLFPRNRWAGCRKDLECGGCDIALESAKTSNSNNATASKAVSRSRLSPHSKTRATSRDSLKFAASMRVWEPALLATVYGERGIELEFRFVKIGNDIAKIDN